MAVSAKEAERRLDVAARETRDLVSLTVGQLVAESTTLGSKSSLGLRLRALAEADQRNDDDARVAALMDVALAASDWAIALGAARRAGNSHGSAAYEEDRNRPDGDYDPRKATRRRPG